MRHTRNTRRKGRYLKEERRYRGNCRKRILGREEGSAEKEDVEERKEEIEGTQRKKLWKLRWKTY